MPHNGETNLGQLMRSESKILAEDIPEFMNIRIKIHGNPQESDINLVQDFVSKNKANLSLQQQKDLQNLVLTMQKFYAPLDFKSIDNVVANFTEKNIVVEELKNFSKYFNEYKTSKTITEKSANLLVTIRKSILDFNSSKDRLQLLDISNQIDNILLIETQNWKTETLQETIGKIKTLSCAALGNGLIEFWEYNEVEKRFDDLLKKETTTIEELNSILNAARSIVEWSASLIKANYNHDVLNYTKFEHLAYGFIDDRVRNSVALNLGETVSKLGTFVAQISNINNDVMSIKNQSSIRGLNPGYAFGKLVVVDGNPDEVEVNTNNIYIFVVNKKI